MLIPTYEFMLRTGLYCDSVGSDEHYSGKKDMFAQFLSTPYNTILSFLLVHSNNVLTRGAESESESPGVVATSRESESELIKVPRLRLRMVYNNLTRLGRAKNKFSVQFSGNHRFLAFRANIGATMKDSDLNFFRWRSPWSISFNCIV